MPSGRVAACPRVRPVCHRALCLPGGPNRRATAPALDPCPGCPEGAQRPFSLEHPPFVRPPSGAQSAHRHVPCDLSDGTDTREEHAMRPAFDWVAPAGWLLLILATAPGGATAQDGVYAPQRTGAAAWQIIGPGEILSACAQDATGLCFTDARGALWTLRTGTRGADVRDAEREQFWPLPVDWVREALEALDPRIPALVACRIYVLPLPRENLPRSSCDGVAIYLSPTVRPATREVTPPAFPARRGPRWVAALPPHPRCHRRSALLGFVTASGPPARALCRGLPPPLRNGAGPGDLSRVGDVGGASFEPARTAPVLPRSAVHGTQGPSLRGPIGRRLIREGTSPG
jgi:hypothetical protein